MFIILTYWIQYCILDIALEEKGETMWKLLKKLSDIR
jgi:hypothetical protein